jgi:hypothetical protein
MTSAIRLPSVAATAPAASFDVADFANPDCPIERVVRSRARAFQLGFAIEAAQSLEDGFPDVVFEPSSKGLRLLARNELALQSPIEALDALYPRKLDLGKARVRYRPGDPVHEPVMTVVMQVPHAFYPSVRLDLTEREALCVRAELGLRAAIVCAEVRQAELLGYHEWLDRTTKGMASVCFRLSHYARVEPPSGPWPA